MDFEMNVSSKKNKSLKALLFAAMVFVVSFSLLVVSVSAWYVNTFLILGTSFNTGELNPQIHLQYWNASNSWEDLAISQSGAFMYAYTGEITDITRLPDDCYIILKIKVEDLSSAVYKYGVFVDNVEIKVFDSRLLPIPASSISTIDYYDATPSQSCFDFYFAFGDDAIPAQTISFGASHQLDTINQSLTDNQFIASNQWVYVKIVPRLAELQNIFKCIPTIFMPYNLEFWFHILGESRAMD